MADATTTTWRVVGIAYATTTHMDSYAKNKDSGMPRFVVEEGTEDEMKDRFSALKRICPVIELYDNNGIVERHDEILDICVKTTEKENWRFPNLSAAQTKTKFQNIPHSAMYARIGELMFRV